MRDNEEPEEGDKHLDPAGERQYLANHSTRTVHSTSSTDPRCQPQPADIPGYGDDLDALEGQGFTACPVCFPERYR